MNRELLLWFLSEWREHVCLWMLNKTSVQTFVEMLYRTPLLLQVSFWLTGGVSKIWIDICHRSSLRALSGDVTHSGHVDDPSHGLRKALSLIVYICLTEVPLYGRIVPRPHRKNWEIGSHKKMVQIGSLWSVEFIYQSQFLQLAYKKKSSVCRSQGLIVKWCLCIKKICREVSLNACSV